MKGEPLPDVKVLLDNHPLHVTQPAKFLSILPPGNDTSQFETPVNAINSTMVQNQSFTHFFKGEEVINV